MVPDARSWWNFHRHIWWMFPPIWHHLQIHVILDSRRRLGGQVESWHGSWCQILMPLSQTLQIDVPSHLTSSPGPCPPRLQTPETWWTGGVLTWLLMSDYDKTLSDTYDECSLPSDTISSSIRNVHVLQRLGGQVESWHGSSCQMKLSQTYLMDFPYHLSPSPGPSGMSISS